jgi:hypothetical protein
MQAEAIDELSVMSRADETESARIVAHACLHSIEGISDTWGLRAPTDCRVCVVTSWMQSMYDVAPWNRRLVMAITCPLWFSRVRRWWPHAGGWSQRFGRRQAVAP